MVFPSVVPVHVTDIMDVHALVAYLRSSSRLRPVVALSVAWNHNTPYVNVDDVVRMVAGRADVVVIPPDMTRHLSELVVDGASVYQGACRVYPPGDEWEDDPYSVPLRMARDDHEKTHLFSLVSQDLKRALAHRPPDDPPVARAPASHPTHGSVSVPTPDSAHSSPHVVPHPSSPGVHPPAAGSQAGPAPAGGAPSSVSHPTLPKEELATKADATALATYLHDLDRQVPVLVVSRAAGMDHAHVDVATLRRDLVGLVEVAEITTMVASWAFAAAMPKHCGVYGGAGRVYPVGDAWSQDRTLSPLRLAYGTTRHDCEQLTNLLLSDAMRMASRGSYETTVAPVGRRAVEGVVIGVAGERGLVNVSGGGMAVLWPELTEPGLPGERLFVKNMAVHGDLDPLSSRIDVRSMRQSPVQAVEAYQAGDTVLVKVASVAAASCTVTLFPGVDVSVDAQDATDENGVDLRYILSSGETTPAAIISHEESDWLLSLTEADEAAAARPAPSILIGGPPWLVPAEEAAPETPDTLLADDDSDSDEDLSTDVDYVRSLRMEKKQLIQRLKDSDARVADLKNQLAQARNQRREATRRRTRADRDAEAQRQAETDQALFLDQRDQLDFEIRLEWARKVSPSDKAKYPLKPWTYSDHFFDTLNQMQGISREKIVEVIVHILTGLAAELPSRQLHRLRTGPGGEDPVRTRNNGEVCYRVSLQHKTPQARRIHYWVCHDGGIELSSVRYHDDLET